MSHLSGGVDNGSAMPILKRRPEREVAIPARLSNLAGGRVGSRLADIVDSVQLPRYRPPGIVVDDINLPAVVVNEP